MGFFADLKADLSQAVNELVPEETQNSVPFEDDLPDMPDRPLLQMTIRSLGVRR